MISLSKPVIGLKAMMTVVPLRVMMLPAKAIIYPEK